MSAKSNDQIVSEIVEQSVNELVNQLKTTKPPFDLDLLTGSALEAKWVFEPDFGLSLGMPDIWLDEILFTADFDFSPTSH